MSQWGDIASQAQALAQAYTNQLLSQVAEIQASQSQRQPPVSQPNVSGSQVQLPDECPKCKDTGPFTVHKQMVICRKCYHLFSPEGADEELAGESVSEATTDEVFRAYECKSIDYGIPHPGKITEATTLAAAKLPPATYPLRDSLSSDVIAKGVLSKLQLEGVLYACQRHQHILPTGFRAGFFLGDQTGIGKGRQLAGMVMDNAARGRMRHFWFSTSTDLRLDAEKDLQALNCHLPVINGCKQLDQESLGLGLSSSVKEGVMFCTYMTLISVTNKASNSKKSQSRLDQLISWCGGEKFDGCLIFDECHKAKNYIPNSEAGTKVAKAVVTLQNLLPNARVVYCSATGVSDIANMAYMERLGLWGGHTSFENFDAFRENFTKRGVGALEMLSVEMKLAGIYVARGLSYQDCTFTTVECDLSDAQYEMYDTAARFWDDLRIGFGRAMEKVSTNKRAWMHFWSTHQRFFKQLLIAMKVPSAVATAQAALKEGCCVVIGLQTTGESGLEKEMENVQRSTSGHKVIPDLISLPKEILLQFIETHFPVESEHLFEKDTRVDGINAIQDIMETDCNCRLLKVEYLQKARALPLPSSALDHLMDELGGPESVAEMTGRKARLVRVSNGFQYEPRCKPGDDLDQINIKEKQAFMDGKRLVAIISDAASTGISLHADRSAKNTRRRAHITIELAWSADKTIQQLGRSHRTNQVHDPHYYLMTTKVGGEKRFASTVAKRMESMGALRGDRRATAGASAGASLETKYGREAMKEMHKAIAMGRAPYGVSISGILRMWNPELEASVEAVYARIFHNELFAQLQKMGFDEEGSGKSESKGDVKKFLNRMLGLEIKWQGILFAYFGEIMQTVIHAAQQSGKFDGMVADIQGETIKSIGDPHVLRVDPISGAKTTAITLQVDRGITWEVAQKRASESPYELSGIYRSKREHYGRCTYQLAILKADQDRFVISRPNTGISYFEEDKESLHQKSVKVQPQDMEEAEQGWRAQYEMALERCIHGPTCRAGPNCKIGMRMSEVDVLCGSITPTWGVLQGVLDKHSIELNRSDRSLRVVRVELDDGQNIVGVRFPKYLLPEVLLCMVDITSAQAGNVKKLVIEEPTAVSIKSMQRAMQPVRTMKDFFAKRPASNSSSMVQQPVSVHQPQTLAQALEVQVPQATTQSRSTRPQTTDSRGAECLRAKIKEDKEVPLVVEDEVESTAKPKATCKSQRNATRRAKREDAEDLDWNGDDSEPVLGKSSTQQATKRSRNSCGKQETYEDEDGAPEMKKSTQTRSQVGCQQAGRRATLAAASQVPATHSYTAQTPVVCPICQQRLPASTTNWELNAHVDACVGSS